MCLIQMPRTQGFGISTCVSLALVLSDVHLEEPDDKQFWYILLLSAFDNCNGDKTLLQVDVQAEHTVVNRSMKEFDGRLNIGQWF